MPSKIASETPFRLSTAFWTIVITFGIGWLVGISHASAEPTCRPAEPSAPVSAPAPNAVVLPLSLNR